MNSNGKRTWLHYPEQRMKPHSKVQAEGNNQEEATSDDELAQLTYRDHFVQGLLMKSGQIGYNKEDEGKLQYPVYQFIGEDPNPKNANPFKPNFFVQEYCYITPSYRVRRSVFKVPGEEQKRHYVYLCKTKGKNMNEMIRFDLADLQPLEEAFASIRAEIDAYPK